MSISLKEDIMRAVYQTEIENIKNGNGLKPLPLATGSSAQTPPLKSAWSSNNTKLPKMWYIFDIQPKEVFVYDISYNSTGHPLFLTYIDGQWIRKSAKYFIPTIGG